MIDTIPPKHLSNDERAALKKLQCILQQSQTPAQKPISPFTNYDQKGNQEDKNRGQQLIAEGKAGCIVAAGGQGTRLGWDGPKGTFPIDGKTLFQRIAERTVSAGKQAGQKLALAIMTSPQNDVETRAHFQDNAFFGLDPDQISFFTQEELPLLNEDGSPFLESPEKIARGPDGNGNTLKHFVNSGTWERWHAKGIRYANFIPVDNPLADPWDAELIGYHHRHEADIIVKCILKKDPEEKVGVMVMQAELAAVIEYTELPEEKKTAKDSDGQLLYHCANTSIFSLDMAFIKTISSFELPLHLAHKAAEYLDKEGVTRKSDHPIAWKFETFIFDILPEAKNVSALMYPREECFAPIKTAADAIGQMQDRGRA